MGFPVASQVLQLNESSKVTSTGWLKDLLEKGVLSVLFAQVHFWSYVLNALIIFLSLLLVATVLIQRGKGGGLAGAFGAAGGSSAFGSKSADQFVKYTLYMFGIWVFLIILHVLVAKGDGRVNTLEENKQKINQPQS